MRTASTRAHTMNNVIAGIMCGMSLALALSGAASAARTLEHETVVDAPVEEVWRMFTTSEGARQWMAPKIEIDFRVGGTIRSSYHPDSTLDDEHTIVNRILTYEPLRMMSIQNEQAPAGFADAELFQQTWSVMLFNPVDDERTRVRFVGLNYGEGPKWDALYKHFEQGNQHLLNVLQQQLAERDADEAAMKESEGAGSALRHEIVVDASLDEAWHAWTTNEGMQSFLVPDSNIDLRIGGPYEIYFVSDPIDGQRGSDGCTILSYLPKQMLSMSWNAPPQFKHAREHQTWLVLRFEEVEDGVRVRLSHYGWEDKKAQFPDHTDEWDDVREYFTMAWRSVLGKLQQHFRGVAE